MRVILLRAILFMYSNIIFLAYAYFFAFHMLFAIFTTTIVMPNNSKAVCIVITQDWHVKYR